LGTRDDGKMLALTVSQIDAYMKLLIRQSRF